MFKRPKRVMHRPYPLACWATSIIVAAVALALCCCIMVGRGHMFSKIRTQVSGHIHTARAQQFVTKCC